MEEEAESRLARIGVLPRLGELLRPHRLRLTVGIVALCLGSGISLLYPMAARYAVDQGMGAGSMKGLDRVLGWFVLLIFLQGGLVWLRHYLMAWIGQRVVTDLRTRVYEHLLTLSSVWFHARRSGEIVGRLAGDVTTIQGVVSAELGFSLLSALQLVGGVVLLFSVDTTLTIAAMLVMPPVVLGSLLLGRVTRRKARRVQDHLADASAQVQESVGAIQTVQAFRREATEARRYRRGVEGAFQEAISLARLRASFFSAVTVGGYCSMALIVWLGSRRVVQGELTAGGLVAFLLYTLTVSSSLLSLASLWGSLQRAGGATLRLFGILDTPAEVCDPIDPVPLPAGGGELSFDGVSFAYPGAPEQPVLRDVSLRLAPGSVVALVGRSGGGKTTITQLAQRFYDVDQGAVRLEGVDLRSLRLSELRGAIATVSQEPTLFHGSVRDNIAFGKAEASDEDIERAARQAHADEFIRELPAGYDTLVGERGVKLSGGQRQRVAIARALLCDPRVLVLDEATSNLDSESEALVQDALARLKHGRTTLVIAHRLSTVVDADEIVVLDRGRVLERGTHAVLMRRSGAYRRLVDLQLVSRDAEG